MVKIGLLSDTHGSLPEKWTEFFGNCDEIWHAGDIGDIRVTNALREFTTVRAVHGNIDGADIRAEFPESLVFEIEKLKVVMIHIGGYPGKYQATARALIKAEKPGLFISGHSHILKVINDQQNNLLHINPGAAGKYGMHHKITLVRFAVDGGKIKNLEIFEKDRL